MSLAELRAQNKMWVLTRFRLQIERYPLNGDSVIVETWASARTDGIRAVREFRFADTRGGYLGRAMSIWLMLDQTRKRPVRLPQTVLDIRNEDRSDPHEFEIPRLKAPENPNRSKVFQVGWKDLDANDHANNVNYVEWALEALPLEIRRNNTLAQLDIEFLRQAFYGDQVTSSAEGAQDNWGHLLKNAEGAVLCVAVSQWNRQ